MSSALERAQAYLRGEKPAQKSTAKSSAPGRGGGSERLSLSKSSVGGSRDVDESDDELQKYLEGLTKRKAASAGSGIPTSSPKASPYLKPGKSQDAKKPDVIKQASYLKSPKPAIDAKLDKNLVDTSSDDEPPRAGIKINANTTESEKTRDAKKGPLSLSADRVMNPPSAALDASKATAKSWGSFKKANKFGDLESDSSSDIDDLSQSIPKYKGNAASLLKKTASQVKSTTAIDNNSTTSSSPATSLNPQLSLVATQKGKKKSLSSDSDSSIGSDFEKYIGRKASARTASQTLKPSEDLGKSVPSLLEEKASAQKVPSEKLTLSQFDISKVKPAESAAKLEPRVPEVAQKPPLFKWPTPEELGISSQKLQKPLSGDIEEDISQISMVDDISEDLVTDREVPLSKIANISDLLKESGDLFSSTTSEKAENSPIKDILEVKDLEPPSRPNTHQLVKDRHNGSSNSKVEESTSAKADTKRNHEAHDAQQSSNFNASLNSRQDHTLSPSITLQHDHTSTPNHHFNHSDSVKNTRSASTQQAPIPPQPTPTYAPYPSQYLPQTPQPSIQYPHPPMPYPMYPYPMYTPPMFLPHPFQAWGHDIAESNAAPKSPSHCHGHHTCGCRPPVPSPQAQIPRMLFEDSSSEEKIRRRHKPKSSKKSKKHSSKEEPKTKFKRKGKERVELEDLEKECEGAASSPTPEASTSKVPFEKRAAPDYTKPLFDDSHTSMFSMPSVNLALMLRLNPNTQILDSMIGNHLEMIRQFVRLNSRLIREDSR